MYGKEERGTLCSFSKLPRRYRRSCLRIKKTERESVCCCRSHCNSFLCSVLRRNNEEIERLYFCLLLWHEILSAQFNYLLCCLFVILLQVIHRYTETENQLRHKTEQKEKIDRNIQSPRVFVFAEKNLSFTWRRRRRWWDQEEIVNSVFRIVRIIFLQPFVHFFCRLCLQRRERSRKFIHWWRRHNELCVQIDWRRRRSRREQGIHVSLQLQKKILFSCFLLLP